MGYCTVFDKQIDENERETQSVFHDARKKKRTSFN